VVLASQALSLMPRWLCWIAPKISQEYRPWILPPLKKPQTTQSA